MTIKLLIVDDDIDTIRLLNNVLRGMGELFFATDGEEAVRVAREKRPDIILLDAQMPGMDGFEACALLKSEPATAEATVIFVTAHADMEHESRALELGALDFIHKPISPPLVRARIRNHITLKNQAEALRRLASTDALTELSNRRAFDEALNAEWRRARRNGLSLALLMVDLDHFKRFNDRYGHPSGDACLKAVAGVLRQSARRAGELAARYGGEEFMLLLPGTDRENAVEMGDNLCRGIRDLNLPHANSPLGGIVTASVGVTACVPDAGIQPADLKGAVDQALYQAKSRGRDQVAWMATLG